MGSACWQTGPFEPPVSRGCQSRNAQEAQISLKIGSADIGTSRLTSAAK